MSCSSFITALGFVIVLKSTLNWRTVLIVWCFFFFLQVNFTYVACCYLIKRRWCHRSILQRLSESDKYATDRERITLFKCGSLKWSKPDRKPGETSLRSRKAGWSRTKFDMAPILLHSAWQLPWILEANVESEYRRYASPTSVEWRCTCSSVVTRRCRRDQSVREE